METETRTESTYERVVRQAKSHGGKLWHEEDFGDDRELTFDFPTQNQARLFFEQHVPTNGADLAGREFCGAWQVTVYLDDDDQGTRWPRPVKSLERSFCDLPERLLDRVSLWERGKAFSHSSDQRDHGRKIMVELVELGTDVAPELWNENAKPTANQPYLGEAAVRERAGRALALRSYR